VFARTFVGTHDPGLEVATLGSISGIGRQEAYRPRAATLGLRPWGYDPRAMTLGRRKSGVAAAEGHAAESPRALPLAMTRAAAAAAQVWPTAPTAE